MEPDAPVPTPESGQQWEPVRRALEGVYGDEPQDEPTLDGLRSSFGDVLPLLLASRFDAMGSALPGLLRDADTLVALSVDGDQRNAKTLRSQIPQAAGPLMLHHRPVH